MENRQSVIRQVKKTKNSAISALTDTSDTSISWAKKEKQPSKSFSFIWSDQDVNENKEIQTAMKYLKRLMACALSTNNYEECKQWLMEYKGDKKIFLIVSNKFGKHIVPDVHSLPWITAIYVYATDRKMHIKWIADYSKVRGVISNTNRLVQKLSMDLKIFKRIKNLSTGYVESSYKLESQGGMHLYSK